MSNVKGEEIVKKVLDWSKDNIRDFPWRKDATPYTILLTELLLRRTTASAVNRVFENILNRYPSLEALAFSKEEDLRVELKTLGYQNQRSRTFKKVSQDLLLQYGGIPQTIEEILTIKQLGLYTAGAILSLGYNKPSPMVDSNVVRILTRYYGKRISQTQAFHLLSHVLPTQFQVFNLSLLDFGALVCRYKNPRCDNCPLNSDCNYYKNILYTTKSS